MADIITCTCESCAVHRLAEVNVEAARSSLVAAQCTRCGKTTTARVGMLLAKRGAITCDRKECRRG
ncbi:hypothetical protein ACTWPB_07405 [Nocardia sp. IBHARD005]|uniref:hypothetical protein n=1 Tax=Nocardia sp. IBHARD005 TaxID=3457765 RepID=UPI004058987A